MVLDELNLFPVVEGSSVNVLFLNFGKENSLFSLDAISKLRENNISTELYPDLLSLKKQLGYANKNNIPYVVFVGDDELNDKKYNLKDMNSGSQELLTLTQLVKKLS
jgi:histidyl-tRNA synthetase